MIYHLKQVKIFWCIPTTFAFLSALGGVINRDIYKNLFPVDYLPGAFPQDLLTILVCMVLFMLIILTKQRDIKKQIIIIGLLGSLFYLYGIFTIERVYNSFYLFYALVFSSSFWSIIYSLAGFRSESVASLQLKDWMLKISAISSIIIALIFTFLWVMAVIPLMKNHQRIEYLYSIYILDLCFVMPAFFITAIMSLRKMQLGILMMPAMMIMGFFVIFPLGLNELAKPSAGMMINFGAMAISFIFSFYMLALAIGQLKMLRLE